MGIRGLLVLALVKHVLELSNIARRALEEFNQVNDLAKVNRVDHSLLFLRG